MPYLSYDLGRGSRGSRISWMSDPPHAAGVELEFVIHCVPESY